MVKTRFIIVLLAMLAFSCGKNLSFVNGIDNLDRSVDLSNFDLYVFQVYEKKVAHDANNKLFVKKYTDGYTDNTGTVVEELYLLFDKQDPNAVYYLTTISNQFTKPYKENYGNHENKKKAYFGYNTFNSPFHDDSVLLNEIDYIRKGQIVNDTMYFSNSTLVTPNNPGPLRITYEKFDAQGASAIRLLNITNDDPNFDEERSPPMLNIKNTLNLDFVFLKSNRKFAYVLPGIDTTAQRLDKIHFGSNSVYFSRKDQYINCRGCKKPYKYAGIRKNRYRQ